MNRANDDEIVPLRDGFEIPNHFPASRRIKTARGLIEEQDFGARNELAGNSYATLLSAGNTFANGSADDGVCLIC